MKKQSTALFLTAVLLMGMWSCASSGKTTKVPKDALPLQAREVLAAGDILIPAIEIISLLDKDISENAVWSIVEEVNSDPNLVLYWIDSMNQRVASLSKDSAIVNGSVVFAKYSLKRTALAMKKAARSGEAKKAAEEVEKDEDLILTEEEKQALSERKNEFSADERKELKNCFIYLACSTAALVNVPIKGKEIIDQAASIVNNPSSLGASALEVPKLVSQLKSIIDNTSNTVRETPDVVKNLAANIEILKAVLAE